MNRRHFICGWCILVLSPKQAWARALQLGFISSSTTSPASPNLVALREGLKAHGLEEGKNLLVDYRFAQSRDELPHMAVALVEKRVAIILAAGSEAIVAARNASKTIPIAMTNSGDAVREGFAVSLARPGGNVTGMTQISPELSGKRIEILREIFSSLEQVGILWNSDHPNTPITFREATTAAEKLGLKPVSFEARTAEDIDTQIIIAAQQKVRAFLVIRDPFTVSHRKRIVDRLHSNGMLAIFETSDFLDAGGLMYFGADFPHLFRSSANYVDRILKGASPADLPIQQPTKFVLGINARVARDRGIAIPQSLMIRADQIIE
jgi:putative ABC transport system substrate-binding protein